MYLLDTRENCLNEIILFYAFLSFQDVAFGKNLVGRCSNLINDHPNLQQQLQAKLIFPQIHYALGQSI